MSSRFTFALVVLLVPSFVQAAAPFSKIDAGRVKKLLRKLDHEDFFVRQQADDELRGLGKAAVTSLKDEMDRSKSLEVRWRLRRILHDMAKGPVVIAP